MKMKIKRNQINTEFILSLLLCKYPKLILDILGYKEEDLKSFELEKEIFDRRVDGYLELKDIELILEQQIKIADDIHFSQIEKIINEVEKERHIALIWIATDFRHGDIDSIIKIIEEKDKSIEMFFIKIGDFLIEKLEKIRDDYHEYEIYDNLYSLFQLALDEIELVSKYKRESTDYKGNSRKYQYEDTKLTEKRRIRDKILEEIKERLYYYPNVYRSKKEENRIFLGSGVGDVTFGTLINRNMEIETLMKFQNLRIEIFENMYENKEVIEKKLNTSMKWDLKYSKIYNTIDYVEENEDEIIRQQVRLLEQLIHLFDSYKES